jgi:hypothetical protein
VKNVEQKTKKKLRRATLFQDRRAGRLLREQLEVFGGTSEDKIAQLRRAKSETVVCTEDRAAKTGR